jgi:CheY-like chemotaxis protein
MIALEKLRTGSFDLVVTDILMPSFSGDQMMKVAREELGIQRPFVVITGGNLSAYTTEQQERIRKYAAESIEKPFRNLQIFAVLRKLLGD